MRSKAITISGIHVSEKLTHTLRERPNSRLRDPINRKAHLPAPFNARVAGIALEATLAPWNQLMDDEILNKNNVASVQQKE
jgi:hypothetical protein